MTMRADMDLLAKHSAEEAAERGRAADDGDVGRRLTKLSTATCSAILAVAKRRWREGVRCG
jgi:hypothetical protein